MDLLRRLQLEETSMLRWFDEMCSKYGINYFALYGTALGAVRHKGFIPWDDDIDVGMLRKDFETFKELTKDQFGKEFILVEGGDDCPYHDKVFPRIYKLGTVLQTTDREEFYYEEGSPKCPIWLDIFLYDFVDSEAEFQKKITFTKKQKRKYTYCKYKYSYPKKKSIQGILKTVAKRMIHLFLNITTNPRKIFEEYVNTIRKDDGKYIASFDPWEQRDLDGSFGCIDELLPTKRMMFEGFELCVPNDVKTHLKKCYGDYMKLPPVEERGGHYLKEIEL